MEIETLRVLFIEDNPQDVQIVQRMLRRYKRANFGIVSAGTTKEGEEALRKRPFDLILLDYMLPGEDGLAFIERLQGNPDLPPIIMLTGKGDERITVQAMQSGAHDYFPKSFITSDLLGHAIHQAIEKFRLADQLDGTDRFIYTLAAAVESRDLATRGHLRSMVHYALMLGQALGLDEHQLTLLRYGSILHDIGKIGMSEATLCKPGPLIQTEWQQMGLHPIIGEKLSAPLRHEHEIRAIVRHHHERWDGMGYPEGLAGENIPFLARVVSVVDAFDAMSSDRPYRKALPLDETIRRLSDGAGTQWDPHITGRFLGLVQHEGLDARES